MVCHAPCVAGWLRVAAGWLRNCLDGAVDVALDGAFDGGCRGESISAGLIPHVAARAISCADP
jgi:hypothetical protein